MAASLEHTNVTKMGSRMLRFCVFYLAFVSCVHCNRKVGENKLPIHQEPDGLSTYSLPLEHTFDQGPSPKFTSRGTLSFRSNKQGPGMFIQTAALTAGEKRKLKDLSQKDGIYRIRVPSSLEAVQDESSIQYVSAFTRVCALLQSGLSDEITITVDQSVNVLGISIVPQVGSCDGGVAVESQYLDNFNTSVSLSVTVPGPVPETQAYVQKMEDERLKKEKGNGADNKSFIAKYWMYIIPVVLFVLVSSGGDQARS